MSVTAPSAFVYLLEAEDAATVNAMRASLPGGIADEPHVTMLFLGALTPGDTDEAIGLFDANAWPVQSAEITGVDQFADSDNGVLHLRIEPGAALRATHERALAMCSGRTWFIAGPYSGAGWSPHITLAIRRDAFDVPALPVEWSARRTFVLRRPAIVIGRPEGVTIHNLRLQTE